MATGRYHQFGVTDPTSNFFKLDYQMLAQPILKADQEYKQMDDAYHQFNQQLSAKEVLPGDVPALNNRVKSLQDAEKKLRDNVSGDILDPRYQEGLRGMIQKESQDNFYRGASWNLNLYKQNQEDRRRHTEKFGESPDAWQDPTGTFFNNYQGFDKSGFAASNPIDPRYPYHEKAVEFAEPMIKKKIDTGEWKEKTVIDGQGNSTKFLVYANQAAVPKSEIKKVIKLSTIGDGSKPWNQLQTIYENSPDLQKQYPTFEEYYNDGVLESVASSLSYKWADQSTIREVNGSYGTDSSSSTKTKALKEKLTSDKIDLKINEGAKDWAPGASNPLGYPDMKLAMKARNYYSSAASDIINGYYIRDEQGNRIHTGGLEDRVYQQLGIPKNNDKGISVNVSPKSDSDDMGVYVSYTSKDGVQRTVDILSGEGLLRKNEMPDEIQEKMTDVMLSASSDAARYTALKHQENEINRFQEKALIEAFGAKQGAVIKGGGFIYALSSDQRIKLYQSPSYKVSNQLLSLVTKGAGVNSQAIYSALGTSPEMNIFADDIAVKVLKQISDGFGINEKDWNPKGTTDQAAVENFVKVFTQERRKGAISANETQEFGKNIADYLASDILTKDGDKRIKTYQQLWKDQWSKGLNENMEPLTTEANASGVKSAPKLIYYYNQTGTTEEASSGKFWKGGKDLLAAEMGYSVGADGNQKATFSNLELFQYNSNEQVKDYSRFADPKNWDLVGIAVDDEGFNIIIKDNNPVKKGQDSWIEIRNRDMVIDYMVQAGMGPQLVFDTTKQMLKGFEDDSNSDNKEFSPVQADVEAMQPYGVGRTRGAAIIGQGIFERPVMKLESTYIDPVTKEKHPPGTFKYYSLAQEKYIYTKDPVEVSKTYLMDRDFVLNGQGNEYQGFSKDTFGGKINISKDILTSGTNTLAKPMMTILTEAIVNDPLLPGTLTMTDATRVKGEALAKANPTSAHLMGNAVDFAVRKANGIDESISDFFFQKYAELKDVARVTLEFPTNHPLAKKYAEKYGDFVSIEQHATGPHIHIEYKQQ